MNNPEEEGLAVLSEALSWSAVVRLQRQRLGETEDWIATEQASGRRVVGRDDATRQTFVLLRADRHFLIVAARNLLRAIDAFVPKEEFSTDWAQHVLVLRNCLEHWDEPDGPSAKQFRSLFPEGSPSSYRFGAGGSHVGELNIDSLVEAVRMLRDRLLEMERDGWVWKAS